MSGFTADKMLPAAYVNEQVRTAGAIDTMGNPVAVVHASGRARCRCCGEKIKRGAEAIQFRYDFGGCGSFTGILAYVHKESCK